MAYFPLFIDIEHAPILIIGGGVTALRKAEKLHMFHADIRFISKDYKEDTKEFIQNNAIDYATKDFEISDLKNERLVIAATNDASVNKVIYEECIKRNIPINSVDDLDHCTFIFPSLYKNKDVVAGVSSAGKSPLVSQLLTHTLKNSLPENIGEMNDVMGYARSIIKNYGTQNERKRILHKLLDKLLEKDLSKEEIDCFIKGEMKHVD